MSTKLKQAILSAEKNGELCNAIKLQVFEANKHAWTSYA